MLWSEYGLVDCKSEEKLVLKTSGPTQCGGATHGSGA